MTHLHDNASEISQVSVASHLKGDGGDPRAIDHNQSPELIVKGFERRMQVPPTLAKLLNPEIVVEAAMDAKSRRRDVGDGAARDNPIPPENTIPKIGQKREIRQNQTDGLQGPYDDSEGDSARKFKRAKLYTSPLLSLSQQDQPPPSPHAVVKEIQIGDGLQVHLGDSIDGSAQKPKMKRFKYTLPLPSLPIPSPEPHVPKKNKKRPKIKWTKQEEKLLAKGLEEGLGWQAICRKYLPHRDRSGCYLHWQAMKAKLQSRRRDWTKEENERLARAMKNRSKEAKEIWAKIAQDMGNERTWKEIEMQQAVLIVEKEKEKRNT